MCSLKIYKPFLLSLALSSISGKGCFYNQSRNMTGAPTFILCCQNECNLFGFKQWEKAAEVAVYFPKWNLKPPSPVHKRQNRVTGRGYLLAKLIKGNAISEWTSCQWKNPLASGQHLKAPTSWEGAIRNLGPAQGCWIHTHSGCPAWSGLVEGTASSNWDQQTWQWMPRKVAEASGYASKAQDTLWLWRAAVLDFRGPLSATHVALTRLD